MKLQTNKHNILYIANKGGLEGGGQLSLWNLVTRLDKDKFKPFFICPADGSFVDMLRKAQINVDIVNFPFLKSLNIFAIISAIFKIKRIIKEKNIDIVHSNGPRMSFLSGLAAKLTRTVLIWHERTMVEKGMWDIDRFLSFLPDKVICNSDAIRQRFLKNGKIHGKVITIINGVDINLFNFQISGESVRKEFNIKDNEVVVGMASRIEPTKGQLYFFEAARDLVSKYDNLKFLMAGGVSGKRSIEYKDKLDEFIAENNLGEKVIFIGVRKDMPQVLAAMDIVVLASDAEGCGRVIFESMSLAKPVVGTNSGGTPEIIQDKVTGLLFPPKDSKSLTESINTLLNDPGLAKGMGEKGRKRVEEHFTIEEHVEKTEKVYEELIK